MVHDVRTPCMYHIYIYIYNLYPNLYKVSLDVVGMDGYDHNHNVSQSYRLQNVWFSIKSMTDPFSRLPPAAKKSYSWFLQLECCLVI